MLGGIELKEKKSWKAGIVLFVVCLLFCPAAGFAKTKTQSKEEVKIEVTDLDSLQEAVNSITEDKPLKKSADIWQSKRLLVQGKASFDAMGASYVIQGYEDITILEYNSVKEAKEAYAYLKNMPGLSVEADAPFEETSLESQKGREILKTAGNKQASVAKRSGGREIVAAVIDSGYDVDSYGGKRLTEGIDLTNAGSISDDNGHGTEMANLILEHTPESVNVMPVKVADGNGRSSLLRIYLGIRYALEHGADIINISMCGVKTERSKMLGEAIRRAKQEGVFVVASAGNAGKNTAEFSPANEEAAIVVSAVDENRKVEGYSNRGECVDYCAYGSVQTSGKNGKKVQASGTSAAAAVVSAVIARRKAYRPDRSYEEIIRLLNESAEDLGEAGKDSIYGNGLLTLASIEQLKMPDDKKKPELLICDWKALPAETFNHYIGMATNLERRIFLEQLNEEELEQLLAMGTMFSENVVYTENSFSEKGETKETYRKEGTLYDIVMSDKVADEYEVQAYRVFHYGQKNKSYIQLDTAYNTNKAKIYCWITDRGSDLANSGKYGITYQAGNSAYQFKECTSGIEDTDTYEGGLGFPVWRINIKKIKVEKPKQAVIQYTKSLWNETGTLSGYPVYKHYWYVWKYQVKPASDAARQQAYGKGGDEVGRWHGGFWDLGNSKTSGGKCGSGTVTTTVDIGNRDLDMSGKEGITYRLPLTEHSPDSSVKTITDQAPSCTQQGISHKETTYHCGECGKTWKNTGKSQITPQLAHLFSAKYMDNNGVPNGKYWEECTRNCGGYDRNGEFWQKNIKYLQPIRYWEMDVNGSYGITHTGTDRDASYYAVGELVPQWGRQPSEEFQTGALAAFQASGFAAYHNVFIPRKQYTVVYDGNGADSGKTPFQQPYCGQVFQLNSNGFYRKGYKFKGYSRAKDGALEPDTAVKNLTLTHQETVTLYAQWEPLVYEITLDGQGAKESGTAKFFEHYELNYYKDFGQKTVFENGCIEIPAKERQDKSLIEGVRKQKFLGYYSEKEGNGDQIVRQDGALVPNIHEAGNYQYFKSDQTVYADWEDMYAVQFDPNLSKKDLEILGKGGGDASTLCPFTRFKAEGEKITVSFSKIIINNKQFSDLYRLKGYSLTPKIENEKELVLSEKKAAFTVAENKDVTLYAQWDTSFYVSYIGNGQSSGENVLDKTGVLTKEYAIRPNLFVRDLVKPVRDVASGQMKDESGTPFEERVPCSFLGYSMAKEKKRQDTGRIYLHGEGGIPSDALLLAAKEAAKEGRNEGLTFGAPSKEYGIFLEEVPSDVPFVNLYAVWDEYPQIYASDIYVPLNEAKKGMLTEEYLLSLAEAYDKELESETNKAGKLTHGVDEENETSFTVQDYQSEDFSMAESEMSLSVTYRAKDSAGNVTVKRITVYLVDTAGKEYNSGNVRFISKEHLGTLAENSIWRTKKYADKLAEAFSNKKIKEEYTTVTPAQKALGIKPVKKADSGTWKHVQEKWEFTNEQAIAVKNYVKTAGVGGDPSGFFQKFGHCKVR